MTPERTAQTRTQSASLREREDAERRRQVLRRLLDRHQISRAELARRIGLTTPNSLYNFLRGRSAGLSHRTIEQILAVFPDADALELVARSSTATPQGAATNLRRDPNNATVVVNMEVRIDHWRRAPYLPPRARFDVWYPASMMPHHDEVFGVIAADPGEHAVVPPGSLLICTPVKGPMASLPDGTKVIVITRRNARYEVTVQTVLTGRDDGTPLKSASQRKVVLQRPDGTSRAIDTETQIEGRVFAAWIPDWTSYIS